MRPHTERLAALLESDVVSLSCRAESWYAGERIAENLPVSTGSGTWTSDVISTAEISLAVPVSKDVDLTDPLNPYGAYGQRLRVFIDITGPDGQVESIGLGWFRTTPSQLSGRTLDLRARDLSLEIERARMVTPTQELTYSVDGNTPVVPAGMEITVMLMGILPVFISDTLDDLTGDSYYLRDRHAGIVDRLRAVSATAAVDLSGTFVVQKVIDPDAVPDPVLTFTDGVRGTITELRPEANESRGYNACIAQGTGPEGAPIYGGAFVQSGPMAWPVQPGVVSPYGTNPGFYASPFLRTVAACKAAAKSILDGWMLGANGSFTVTCGPDPRLEEGDVVTLVKGAAEYQGLVQAVTLPFTATSGEMTFSGVLL